MGELLGKISSRYDRFMSVFISDRTSVIKSVTKKVGSLTARLEKEYNKLNSKCKFSESSDADADSERFNRCKAVNRLQSVLLNWTRAYSMNCENPKAAVRWFDRVERHSDKITKKLMRQKSIKNAENCE